MRQFKDQGSKERSKSFNFTVQSLKSKVSTESESPNRRSEAQLRNKTLKDAPAPKIQTESRFKAKGSKEQTNLLNSTVQPTDKSLTPFPARKGWGLCATTGVWGKKNAKFEAQASASSNFKPETLNSSSLSYFRIFFGFMMLFSSIRFLAKGWVQELYVDTTFNFKYWGFEWIEPLGNFGTHALFIGIAITAFFVMIGMFYRTAIVLFFLLFSYAELMDATNYLNHYYFVSVVAFILIWLPANAAFSVDALRNPSLKNILVPNWAVNVLKLQIALVYVFAGIAKINYDWLIEAEPLFHWLRAKYDFPILGPLFQYKATAYFFSWSGCLYDLSVPFLLLYKPTRIWAFAGVVFFHVITSLLFPIGIFPFVMIGSATLFFSSTWHLRTLRLLASLRFAVESQFKAQSSKDQTMTFDKDLTPFPVGKGWGKGEHTNQGSKKQTTPLTFKLETLNIRLYTIKSILAIHFIIQIALPFRHYLYQSNLYWTEEGYRFSWRVMLTDKAGLAFFTVKDANGKKNLVDLDKYLTERQQKFLATNPDFMVQFAHFLKEEYAKKDYINPEVFVESYLNLNGKGSKAFTNPNIDLATESWGLSPKTWLLPFNKTES